MARQQELVSIDIGAHRVRTVIAQKNTENDILRVIGIGDVPSNGLRRGAIVDVADVTEAIALSVEEAEKMSGSTVRSAIFSVGGTGVSAESSKGVVAIGRADGEVAEDDVRRVLAAAQAISIPLNKEIIHIIPKKYSLDDQDNIKDPTGMHGVRLEVDAIIIEVPTSHVKNITLAASQAKIDIEELVVAPLAASVAVLDKKQKELGVACVDIGGSTISIAVFEEGDIIHTAIIPIGAMHLTNDIAIGLRTSVETAETVKKRFGNALAKIVDKSAEINLGEIDSQEDGYVSEYHVAEIIEARLEEMLLLVEKELETIGKNGLLPAGVVLTGGGANLPNITECAKNILRLPVQVGYPRQLGGIIDKIDDPDHATSVGLLLWAQEQHEGDLFSAGKKMFGGVSEKMSGVTSRLRKIFEKFLP